MREESRQLTMPGFTDQKQVLQDIRNYLAGQSIGLTRDESLLDEVLKCAFCRAEIQRNDRVAPSPKSSSSEQLARGYRRIFRGITARFPHLFEQGSEILLGPEQVKFVDEALSLLGDSEPTRDLVGDIYETFIGSAVRGQDGQFFTPKNAVGLLVHIARPAPHDLIIDPACGAGSFLVAAAQRVSQTGFDMARGLHGVDKDAYLGRLARLRLALQFGDTGNVHCADSLAWAGGEFGNSETHRKRGTYTLVLTNPPFGSRIVAANGEVRGSFILARKWRLDGGSRFATGDELQNNPAPQVLFVERCLSLLAPGGRLGIVLPESLLSNPSHRYVVQYILDHATVVAVVGMPESLFKTSGKGGTHTKVCLLVVRKEVSSLDHKVFMAEAKWCGHDSRGREIPKDDLPEIAKRFDVFRSAKSFQQSRLGFVVAMRDIRNLVLAPRYYDPEPRNSLRRLSSTHELMTVRDLTTRGHLSIGTGDEPGKLVYGTGDVPFVRTSDLSNWEVKIDPKHCVSEEYYQQVAKRQDVQEGDILMVRDGTYLIGTCAMITRYDVKICYQSHIYKIRVHRGAPLDCYLLLALLSSEPVVSQIRAFSFTQDIIDSLGDRIHDLVLPIPRSAAKRRSVSDIVRKVIRDRIEARELARQARELVVG